MSWFSSCIDFNRVAVLLLLQSCKYCAPVMHKLLLFPLLSLVQVSCSDSPIYLEPLDTKKLLARSHLPGIDSSNTQQKLSGQFSTNGIERLEADESESRFFKFSTTESPQDAFFQRRIFNSSIALTIPVFSFILPTYAAPGEGSPVDLANQAIFGLFGLFAVILFFTVPVMFNGMRADGRSFNEKSSLNSLIHSSRVYNLMSHDVSNQIGLDREKCLQNIICEAHQSPEKYGLVALPFAIFFPPPSDKMSAPAPYQKAAQDGKSPNCNCRKKYQCFFDFLELTVYFIDMWKYSNDNKDVTYS